MAKHPQLFLLLYLLHRVFDELLLLLRRPVEEVQLVLPGNLELTQFSLDWEALDGAQTEGLEIININLKFLLHSHSYCSQGFYKGSNPYLFFFLNLHLAQFRTDFYRNYDD